MSKSVTGQNAKAGTTDGLTGLPPTHPGQILNKQPISWGTNPCEPEAEAILQQIKPKDPAGRPIQNDPLSNAIAQYKKNFSTSMSNVPADNIPRSELGPSEIAVEIKRLRELASRAVLSATSLPSISCYTLHNTYDAVTSISMNSTGTLMATGNRDSYIDVWSLTKEPLKAVRPSTELAAMDLSNLDNIDELKENEGSPTKRLIGHSGPVYATRFMPPTEERFLISASQDRTLRLWSLDLFAPIVVYRSHTMPVWDVDVPSSAAAGPYFCSASADRTARLWSTEHIHPLRIFAGHLADVDTVKFHPNAAYIATGSTDKTCRLWDIHTGQCVRLFAGHERGITALAFSPDGRLLASGDRLGKICIWDIAEGRLLRGACNPQRPMTAQGQTLFPESPVYSISFCQDGKILAQAGADAAVHLWDVSKTLSVSSTDAPIASYPTKQTPLYTSHFTPSNVLLTAGVFNPDM